METVKTDNDRTMETSPHEAGFFYRRIGGTLFKVRVYTGAGYADTLDKKIPRLILQDKLTKLQRCYGTENPNFCSLFYFFLIYLFYNAYCRRIYGKEINKTGRTP